MHLLDNSAILLTLVHSAFLKYTQKAMANVPFHILHLPSGTIFLELFETQKQVSKICQSANLELRRISSVRHVLTVDAAKTLVTSLVLSRLEYCNSLLSGIP